MATVGSVIDQALQLVNRVDSSYRQRALYAIERGVRHYAERLPWPSLIRQELFYSNGTDSFVFPQRVRQLISVGDNTHKAYVPPGGHFERQYPEWQLGSKPSGGPFQWRPAGDVPVIQDPAAATYLELNTTASDSQTVYVRGTAQDTSASGTPLEFYDYEESVTALETPVTTSALFYRIFSIEAANLDRSNDIFVRYSTDAVPAARIPTFERHSKYKKIEWLAKPAAGAAFTCRYYADPVKINSETQALDPQIPEDYLVWRIVGDLHWIAEQPQAAQAAWGRADELMRTKIEAETTHGDQYSQAIPYAPFITDDEGAWE